MNSITEKNKSSKRRKKRDSKILYKLKNMHGDILNEHFLANSQRKCKKKKNHKKIDAFDKAITGGQAFESNKSKH